MPKSFLDQNPDPSGPLCFNEFVIDLIIELLLVLFEKSIKPVIPHILSFKNSHLMSVEYKRNQNKEEFKKKSKPNFLTIENYLNFKESGKIPDFLNTK